MGDTSKGNMEMSSNNKNATSKENNGDNSTQTNYDNKDNGTGDNGTKAPQGSNGRSPPPPYNRAQSQFSFNLGRVLRRRNQIERLIDKNGVCNMQHTHIKYRSFQYISDSFTTLIDIQWRYTLCVFTLSYVLSWFLFAILWYIFAYAHGDVGKSFDQTDDFDPCVYNVETFTGAFLFSIETQTTIGYGFRSVSEECPHAAILVVIQSVVSYLINSIMLGLIFAKIARPKKRAATLKFSRHAVVAKRNGKLCLMFRVGNIRNSTLFEAHVRAYVIKPKITPENEYIPLHYYDLNFLYETGEDRVVLMWPLIVCHEINEKSPLYHLCPNDLLRETTSGLKSRLSGASSIGTDFTNVEINMGDFEILVILEGVVEQTGLVTQVRTSYLPSEIKWGHRFSSQVISLKSKQDRQFQIDYEHFNTIYKLNNFPTVSAAKLNHDLPPPRARSSSTPTDLHPIQEEQDQTDSSHQQPKNQEDPNHQKLMLHHLKELTDKINSLENTIEKKTVIHVQESLPLPAMHPDTEIDDRGAVKRSSSRKKKNGDQQKRPGSPTESVSSNKPKEDQCNLS